MTAPELPPPPHLPPAASFTGGIRSKPIGWGGSWPFGHLEFDYATLTMHGAGLHTTVRRDEVRAIRFRTRFLSTSVTIARADGTRPLVRFIPMVPEDVRRELLARGWPVEDGP